jgi:ABC-type phosphate transport system substrate-binding protein
MAVVVSPSNQTPDLTSTQLGKIFRGETRKWSDGRDVVLVLHRASAGEAVTLEHLNKMSPAQFQAWSNEHHALVKIVDSDQDVLTVIETTPGAVGLVDVRDVNSHVRVLHIDGKLPLEDGYLPH